jgi:hypothetical protein
MTTSKNHKAILEITGTKLLDQIGEIVLIKGLYGDDYEVNATKAEDKGMDACGCCGRAVKPGRGFDIWVINGGNGLAPTSAWPTMYDHTGDWLAGNLGCLVVGPDCGKQIPTDYRMERSA